MLPTATDVLSIHAQNSPFGSDEQIDDAAESEQLKPLQFEGASNPSNISDS